MIYQTEETKEKLKKLFKGELLGNLGLDDLFEKWKTEKNKSFFVKDGIMLKNDDYLNHDIDKKWADLPRRIVFLMMFKLSGRFITSI